MHMMDRESLPDAAIDEPALQPGEEALARSAYRKAPSAATAHWWMCLRDGRLARDHGFVAQGGNVPGQAVTAIGRAGTFGKRPAHTLRLDRR